MDSEKGRGLADVLLTHGWTQGDEFDVATKEVCLIGAASVLVFGEEYYTSNNSWDMGYERWLMLSRPKYEKVIQILADVVLQRRDLCITDFNDDPDMEFDEILRVAKEADELLEKEGCL